MQSVHFFVPVCDIFCLTSWAIPRVAWHVILLVVAHLPFVSFWELGTQDLEFCRSNSFLSEHNIAVLTPIMVQRMF